MLHVTEFLINFEDNGSVSLSSSWNYSPFCVLWLSILTFFSILWILMVRFQYGKILKQVVESTFKTKIQLLISFSTNEVSNNFGLTMYLVEMIRV